MGTGSFVSAALETLGERIGQVVGYEIDPDFYEAAKRLWSRFPIDVKHADFTHGEASPTFDLVVANPPYVRHHKIDSVEKRRLQALVKRQTGLSISGLAGLYCYFLLMSQAWMRVGALGVWLLPSEWMSVNYGGVLREFFTKKVRLLRVHQFDAADVQFSDALVSSCVVLFSNLPPNGENVAFTYGPSVENPMKKKDVDVAFLSQSAKWASPNDVQEEKTEGLKLGDFFDIRRGIATGDNEFFVLTESEASERKIPRDFLRPILPSPRYLKVDHIESDSDGLPTNAERRYLLDCTGFVMDDLPDNVRSYLLSGAELTGRRNLCSSRKVWYDQEQREATPFLCSYMGRGKRGSTPVRFILNETKAIALNSFLMLYPKWQLAKFIDGNVDRVKSIWQCLLQIDAHAIIVHGRTYGGGLQKVEPKELASIPCRALQHWMMAQGVEFSHVEKNGQLRLFA